MLQTETQLVHAYMDWVGWKANSEPLYSYIYHIVNEGKRSHSMRKSLGRAGMRRGLPDYSVPLRTQLHAGLWIEFKTETGRLSKHQIIWIKKLRYVGHQVVVCRCLSDAQFVTEQYIALAKAYLEPKSTTVTDNEPLWEFSSNVTPGGLEPRRLPISRSNLQGSRRKKAPDATPRDKPQPKLKTIKRN